MNESVEQLNDIIAAYTQAWTDPIEILSVTISPGDNPAGTTAD